MFPSHKATIQIEVSQLTSCVCRPVKRQRASSNFNWLSVLLNVSLFYENTNNLMLNVSLFYLSNSPTQSVGGANTNLVQSTALVWRLSKHPQEEKEDVIFEEMVVVLMVDLSRSGSRDVFWPCGVCGSRTCWKERIRRFSLALHQCIIWNRFALTCGAG